MFFRWGARGQWYQEKKELRDHSTMFCDAFDPFASAFPPLSNFDDKYSSRENLWISQSQEFSDSIQDPGARLKRNPFPPLPKVT